MYRNIETGIPFDNVDPFSILKNLEINNVNKPFIATGIHITTLNALMSGQLTKGELNEADLIYADGLSVEITMLAAGLRNFRRYSTTDLISLLFLNDKNKTPLRVALLGGISRVSELAAAKWVQKRPFDSVWNHHGYESNWSDAIQALNSFSPHLVLIGFGMPLELLFLIKHKQHLPNALYLTCGGYLRILAEVEKRAPIIMQRALLEWLYRLVSNPRQTHKRYILGLINMIRINFRLRRLP